jgi:ferredoxin
MSLPMKRCSGCMFALLFVDVTAATAIPMVQWKCARNAARRGRVAVTVLNVSEEKFLYCPREYISNYLYSLAFTASLEMTALKNCYYNTTHRSEHMIYVFNSKDCTGCLICELVCSFHNSHQFSGNNSSIKVKKTLIDSEKGVEVLINFVGDHACNHCVDERTPLCVQYCPEKVLRKEGE